MVHFTVVLIDVVAVICRNQRDAGLLGKPDNFRIDQLLLPDSMVLQFQIKIPLSKNPVIAERGFLGRIVIPRRQGARDLARKAGGSGDQSLVVLLKKLKTAY